MRESNEFSMFRQSQRSRERKKNAHKNTEYGLNFQVLLDSKDEINWKYNLKMNDKNPSKMQ